MEQWAELRRQHFVGGKSIKQLARETGLSRNTVRAALRSKQPPVYRRAPAGSVLDPFKDEIHRLLREDPALTGVRVRELLEPLGCRAGKTVVDDYLREVRPLFAPAPRTFARAVWRPGEVCQFDVWQPREEVPVGHGQTRRGYVVDRVLGLLARGRRGVGVLDPEPRICWPGSRAAWSDWAVCRRCCSGTARPGIHGHGGRPTEAFAAFCGQLRVGWRFCAPADPQAKGAVERLQGYAETNFEPGRASPTSSTSRPSSTPGLSASTPARTRALKVRPVDRLADERLAPLPAAMPDCARRWVTRVPPDPYLRVDTNDYSLDPAAGRPPRRGDASTSATSRRSRWTPARSPAATAGSSRATGRSPRSSTPAR